MPPKRKAVKSIVEVPPVAAASSASASTGVEPGDHLKVYLYDAGALKNSLDDVAKQVVMDAGYDEDLSISNVKITIGLLAIAVALYAQLGPGKFPATWWTVAACVLVYVALTMLLNVYSWQMEGDAFLVTKPRRARDAGLRLTSRMDRFADAYVLIFSSKKDAALEARLTTTVTKYFHADGYLAEEAFRRVVEGLLLQYEGVVSGAQHKKTR